MLLLLLFTGCAGNIHQLYQSERDAALAQPPKPPADWQPDLRLRLSDAALQDVATAAVDGGLLDLDQDFVVDGPLGVRVRLRPSARVKRIRVGASEACEACLAVTGALSGDLRWQVGPLDGSVPFTADLSGALAFAADSAGGGWDLSGRLKKVDQLAVSVGPIQRVEVGRELRSALRDALRDAPAIPLGRIGGAKLPLVRLRVVTGGGHVEVQGLSDVAGHGAVSPGQGRVAAGWELRLSEQTVSAMLRRQAFHRGLLDKEVALDPRALDFDGDRFTMDLRLWRLAGAGWWRDYTVEGTAKVVDGEIRLRSKDATEAGKSRGAGLADPIALLGEARILEAVANGVRQAVPAGRAAKVAGTRLMAESTHMSGDGDALVVVGTASLE